MGREYVSRQDRSCVEDGCKCSQHARGFCRMHYQRERRKYAHIGAQQLGRNFLSLAHELREAQRHMHRAEASCMVIADDMAQRIEDEGGPPLLGHQA